jgi:hypothetical protein
VKAKSTEWLTRARDDARVHAEIIRQALAEDPHRTVVLPNRQLVGAPSVMTLAALLQRTRTFPAIVVVCPELIEFDRVALSEATPAATIQVIDWCHPAPAEPADITLLSETQLPRSAGTLAGYDAATVAIFTGITAAPNERHHQAIRSLLHAASDPLIVMEEWTHPDILATAVARLTGTGEQDAGRHVDGWLEQPHSPVAGGAPRPCPAGLLPVRDLTPRTLGLAA